MPTQLTTGAAAVETGNLLRHASNRIRRAAAVVAAVAAATVTWLVLTTIAGITLRVPTYARNPPLTSALGLGQVIITTLIAALLAWGVLATLEHVSGVARRLWTIIAPLAAIASLLLPLSASALAWSQRLPLVVFHVVVASVLIVTMRGTLAVAVDPRTNR